MKKNIIVNSIGLVTSFGLGMLAMNKIFEWSFNEYIKKNGTIMDKYKDNEVIMAYYNDFKKKR